MCCSFTSPLTPMHCTKRVIPLIPLITPFWPYAPSFAIPALLACGRPAEDVARPTQQPFKGLPTLPNGVKPAPSCAVAGQNFYKLSRYSDLVKRAGCISLI